MPPPNKPGTVASRGPIVPQKFFLPPQPEPPGNVISEEDGDWWVNVFQCGAVVTLAAALSVAATTSVVANQVATWPQDEPPAAGTTSAVYSSGAPPTVIFKGNQLINYWFEEINAPQSTAAQPEEDFWSPQIPPTQWNYLQPFTDDVVIVPQPAPANEELWQNPVPPPVTYLWPQQFSFDQNDLSGAGTTFATYSSGAPPIVILQGANRVVLSFPDEVVPQPGVAFQPDEDFWQNPVPPVPLVFAPFQPWVDEQTPLLFGQPDEDFWINPTPPVAGSLLYPQQWVFDEQTPALTATVDEYFWQNPTAPVAGSLLWPQQASFDEQFPTLFGQMDEDFWTPQIPSQLWSVPVQAFSDDEIITQQVSTQVVDEFFFAPLLTCAYPNFLLQQWQFETGDNGGLTPPPVITPKINILRWASTGSRMTPPYNP